MPDALALDPSNTIMPYKGITSTYKTATAWASFLTEILTGVSSRRVRVYNVLSVLCGVENVRGFCFGGGAPGGER